MRPPPSGTALKAYAFGEIFKWATSAAGFPVDALSPRVRPPMAATAAQAICDRDTGLDHLEYDRRSL